MKTRENGPAGEQLISSPLKVGMYCRVLYGFQHTCRKSFHECVFMLMSPKGRKTATKVYNYETAAETCVSTA